MDDRNILFWIIVGVAFYVGYLGLIYLGLVR